MNSSPIYFTVVNSSTNQAYGYFFSLEQAEHYVSLTGSLLCEDTNEGISSGTEKSGSQNLIIKEHKSV